MFNREVIQNSKPAAKFFFALFIVVAICATILLISETIASKIFQASLLKMDVQLILTDPRALLIAKIAQLIISSVFFIIPPFIIAWCYSNNTSEFLNLRKPQQYIFFIIGAALIIGYVPLVNFITDLNKMIHLPSAFQAIDDKMKSNDNQLEKVYNVFMKADSPMMYLFNIFVMAFIPAIGEELFFRGALQRMFTSISKNKHAGVIVTAIVFSAIHFQFSNFLPRFFLGALFGYIVLLSGSLWITILIHFLNNLMALSSGINSDNAVMKKLETLGTFKDNLWTVIPSAIIVGSIMWYFYKKRIIEEGKTNF